MIDNERLVELTESYLKSLVRAAVGSMSADFAASAPFGELGVDSFRVLKIIKALEADFGRLPKTLLFENFNVADLAQYFIAKHEQTLRARLSSESAEASTKSAVSHVSEAVVKQVVQLRPAARPILMAEREAYAHPEFGSVLRSIFEQYKNEGSVSRGTRNIAPNLFIGSERHGFFHYSRSTDIILAYTYTGPRDYFPTLAKELYEHCASRKLSVNIVYDEETPSICGIPFSSTPFGALQRVLNLQQFTLDGKSMRRLRYQVSKFEKAGNCRTEEFRCGADPEVARAIAGIIDLWCAARTMVNPLIHIVKDEILAGTLDPQHRIFVTYLDDVLQNAILISPLAAEQNGYLMDLEFYPDSMPLGGLEFTIVKIIEQLVAEGCDVLSLGGTYGCKLGDSTIPDPAVEKILDDLRMQNIFNDEGNLQFKNKFRPLNKPIFLCRPRGQSNADEVLDIIMMIADPMKMQTSDAENQEVVRAGDQVAEAIIEGEARSADLLQCGFNPLNLLPHQVEFDLKTDSWAQLRLPAIENQRRLLSAQLHQRVDLSATLTSLFPFSHFALTTSGRTAESVFCSVWPRKGVVLQNLLFPTTIFHQMDNALVPTELPHAEVFRLDSTHSYKGEMDWAGLQREVARDPASIAFVCIEVSDNATGGHPVSIEHLKRVKQLLSKASIPLVLDGTRIVENAQFVIENEPGYAGKTVWSVVREILGFADVALLSFGKDFCVTGGLIAVNDSKLFQQLQERIRAQGCGLSGVDRKLLALALQKREYIESRTSRRRQSVRRIWDALKAHGVPVVQPAGAHCILIDVKQVLEFKDFKCPVASFLAWMFLNTGIRGGAHNAGMQRNTVINDLVRLAIPLGLTEEQVDSIIDRLQGLFAQRKNIPELVPVQESVESVGDIHGRYRLIQYHNASGRIVSQTSKGEVVSRPAERALPSPSHEIQSSDIAIIGMAGRYPQANNLQELWQSLVSGKDCIEPISEARLALRSRGSEKYRGGFIADVDKFDARFFNISAREAEVLDPQERLFLEVAYETLEDAGYYPESLSCDNSREVGVFVGAVWSMYQMLGLEERIGGSVVNPSSFFWSIANRVSHWMNFSGPSLTVDTACSASLTALHLACEAIRRGECFAALVGGVNLDLHQAKLDLNSAGGSFSRDGVCRSFGKGANGYVSGEGVGAVLLKRLDQAIADGDNIHGVIKSVAVTHSGRTSGYTVPGPQSQSKLILKALQSADIDARTIGYIEAHGTATDLGDAIEIAGLTRAYQEYGVEKQSCPIGSVKTNIGHLEAASGIVGVQKVLLQMKHRTLVPSLHSSELNEGIDFAGSQFYVQQRVEEWTPREVDGAQFPRRAGISAIGAGGTNAHVIIEEHERGPRPDQSCDRKDRIFPISADSEAQLREAVERLHDFLASHPSYSADDVAHTLQKGRKSFDYRLAVIAGSLDELAAKLSAHLQGRSDDSVMNGYAKNAAGVTGLLNSTEKQEFIELLVRSGDPRRLARLWCDGVIADWRDSGFAQTGRKVSLPTYPFAGERYWLKKHKAPAELAVKPVQVVAAPTPKSKRAEKYHFSFGSTESLAAGTINLGLEEKVRLFVRQLIATQLRTGIEEVDDARHLMETGITSLDMAEMTQSIKLRVEEDFSPIVFFECTTIRSFAALLAQRYASAFEKLTVTRLTVDEHETVVPLRKRVEPAQSVSLHLHDADSELAVGNLEALAPAHQGKIRRLFLTGATGFLGSHVLAEFLGADPDATAYCLVRAASNEQGLQRILKQAEKFELPIDGTRITVVCGDIAQPKLGLSAEDWELCARETQQIVHASARVNHIEGYATFRDSTLGMKEIIRLASTDRVKLIQFVSSIAGCALKIGEEFSIFEKEAFVEAGAQVYGGYGQSKWVQETLLRRAAERGVPYVIYRFGELSGSALTGLGQTDDIVHRLLQMRLAVGCREKVSNDVLDMLPVDFAARLIVNTGGKPELWNTILHATHLKPYSFANMYRRAQSHGLQFTPVTRAAYLSRCYDFVRFIHSINPVNGFVLECVLRDAEGSVRARKMMDAYFSVIFPFAQDNFRRSLQVLGLALPEWGALIDSYFARWNREDCGFMARIADYRRWTQMDAKGKAVPGAAQEEVLLGKVNEA
ncbi:aminotransferase class I/II-fold pyridoxal phosphate-dependent enzyme [Steroidobacter cummioxidans]|uniref:aminotransferase class I/II-fold pyridoxal phosphate-dependent enzyme n=1 Tax=Steroidobacter cummioxidans TaxID=1803913 RepID=UPI000E324A93|nr:aminotransferase class I/II-fold pyridoxal phosphate-dependent enzyme [Steroidobacter cummioxidans]